MGEKIPKAERPSVETLERFLALSPEVRQRFFVDLQNDCDCPTEMYDVVSAFMWAEDGPTKWQGRRAVVPVQPGVLTDDIVHQLDEFAGGSFKGVVVVNLRGWGLIVDPHFQ